MMNQGVALLFKYKGGNYKVTVPSETLLRDYKTLLETGSKIKKQHDKLGDEKPFYSNLEFSYQSARANEAEQPIFSDESLAKALDEIMSNKKITINIRENEPRPVDKVQIIAELEEPRAQIRR